MPNKTEREIERDKKVDELLTITQQILAILKQEQGEKADDKSNNSRIRRK